MVGSLPGGSPQEIISPLENVLSMDSQNKYASLTPTNPYAHISNSNSPVPLSTYSCSPAPSDFSLPLHASHPQAQPLPQCVFETVAPQVQLKSTMANLDVDMAAYTQGLANFDISLDMACPTSYLRSPRCRLTYPSICSPMHFQHQQQHQAHLLIAAPVAVSVDNRARGRHRASRSCVPLPLLTSHVAWLAANPQFSSTSWVS